MGEEGGWTSPERDEAIHEDIGGSFRCKFRGGNSEHVRTTAGAVREEEGVEILLGRGMQGPKVVNADGNARTVGQGKR